MKRKMKNKDIIQSYILTTAKYDFSVFEKRILYRIIELNQYLLEGKTLNKNYNIEIGEQGVYYTLPINSLMKNPDDKNHHHVKEAFRSLQKKTIEYQDDRTWASLNIIANPKMDEYSDIVTFYVDKMIYKPLLDFSKGYRKYELAIAMQFESVYSMRFYEMMSEKKEPITYYIDDLKELFGLENKYKLVGDFRRYVLDVAKRELDNCSPYTFDYTLNKKGRRYISVTFTPKFQPQFRDEDIEKSKLNQKINISWYLDQNEKNYFLNNLGFTPKGIKNNSELIEKVKKKKIKENILFIEFLSELKTRALRSNVENFQGYVISALKSEINDGN